MSKSGFNPEKKLYKNPDQAKICGVCAGIAEYFGFEVWVVRIIAASMLLLGAFNGMVVIAYLVLTFVLDPKPGSVSNRGCFGVERKRREESEADPAKPYNPTVKDVWKEGQRPSESLEMIESKFSRAEKRLQQIESFVTSNRFELEKEFNKMGA